MEKSFLLRGGRLSLIQSVLASLPIYYLLVFRTPVGVAGGIEKYMRDFFLEGVLQGKCFTFSGLGTGVQAKGTWGFWHWQYLEKK